ncbi:unnamed protein product [Pleuronectes platessa]|uniref:Uncharacterized protein n=1 Tax=Pleuronectes platessa TaxID=8262 RepID=A0A9N7UKY1_PLEPL|nr:unnamed protein product [Pleuronectes platessa]
MAECENNHDNKQPSSLDTQRPNLSELLDRGWKIFEEVDSTNLPLGSSSIQVGVKRGIGALTMKQTSRDKRLQIVQTARAYFMDFLRRCKEYNISNFKIPTSPEEDPSCVEAPDDGSTAAKSGPCQSDLVAMAAQRQTKIERYRQKKDLETRLTHVRGAIDSGLDDDDVNRDFYLLNVQRWVTVCLEEIESIDQEVEILNKMDVLKHSAAKQPTQPVRPPMKPFILTKNALQVTMCRS